MTEVDRLAALMESAANLGADYKVRQEAADSSAKKNRADRDAAAQLVGNDDFAAKGFNALRYDGLVAMGKTLAQHFNADSDERRDAARAMADSFIQSFTGQGVKSLNGGKQAGYAATIDTGNHAADLRDALQRRLEHWRSIHDSDVDGESPAEANARKAEAKRYMTPCGDAPMPDGSHPTDKSGKPRTPKFNGRPACTVNGVVIEYGRGTDRDAQLAAFARLFRTYGDVVMSPQVVDAFLDNGGRYKANGEKSIADLANDALTALDGLAGMAGDSPDGVFLKATAALLGRISREGFKAAHVAAAPMADGAGDAKPEAPAMGDPESILADAAAATQDGTAGEGAPEVAEGAPVALGAPTGRPRRNRSKKEDAKAA